MEETFAMSWNLLGKRSLAFNPHSTAGNIKCGRFKGWLMSRGKLKNILWRNYSQPPPPKFSAFLFTASFITKDTGVKTCSSRIHLCLCCLFSTWNNNLLFVPSQLVAMEVIMSLVSFSHHKAKEEKSSRRRGWPPPEQVCSPLMEPWKILNISP